MVVAAPFVPAAWFFRSFCSHILCSSALRRGSSSVQPLALPVTVLEASRYPAERLEATPSLQTCAPHR